MDSSTSHQNFAQQLKEAMRGDVLSGQIHRGMYATDASHYQITPQCVVLPRDETDCIAAIKLATKHHIPITSRGGGTSLSGQTHGPGMIVDLSKHMNNILEINVDQKWVRVQPGVIRDQLNAQLRSFGLQFAPDPATGNRCTIGGMIGNNSSGARSIKYGKTSDHILSCRLVLSNGEIVELDDKILNQWHDDTTGNLYQHVKQIVDHHHNEIIQKYPKVMRRVSGYALDTFLTNPTETPWNLSQLVCGSEGTLGVLTEAKLRLVALPKATAMCVIHFNSLPESLNAIESILTHNPSAVELLDEVVIRESKTNSTTKHLTDFIIDNPAAILLVEFEADDADDKSRAKKHVESFAKHCHSQNIGYAQPVFLSPKQQNQIWEVRKLGLGLITNVTGPTKGQAFIEDACIPLPHLPQYVQRVLHFCKELKVNVSLYGHASVGVLHIRPMLDLHQPHDIELMKKIAQHCFDMVCEYGGAWSGEHGDGLVRGQFIKPFFGDALYDAFRQIKELFDPHHRMNPGKIIDPPNMDQHLRYQQPNYNKNTAQADHHSLFHFRKQGGLTLAVEQCNGVGACRKIGEGVMCPSYMATRNETDCTRGRANALRLAISGQLTQCDPKQAMASDELHEVMQLCLSCKACQSECPNAVDVAKMKAEVLQHRYDLKGTPIGVQLIGALPDMAKWLTGYPSPIMNYLQNTTPARKLLHHLCHIDPRRPLPKYARQSLMSVLKKQKTTAYAKTKKQVVLFIDSYTNAYDPHVGQAAIALLESCGYQVTPLLPGDSQRARISKGLLHQAKKQGDKVLRKLDEYANKGCPILCLEPSCATSLCEDLPDLSDDQALSERVAKQVDMIDCFLADQGVLLKPKYPHLLIHGHCHQKSSFGLEKMQTLLPDAKLIDSGCCGMAGSFGYEQYDLSIKIAEDRLLPAIKNHPPDTVVVACGFSCRQQIHDTTGIMPKHFVEVVEK